MDQVVIAIYTHTDYSDIWPLVFHCLHQHKFPCQLVLVTNSLQGQYPIPDSLFQQTILYDDTLTYPQRLVTMVDQLSTPYVAFIHEIELIIHFDSEMFSTLMNLVLSNTIDRCMFGMVPKQQECIDQDGLSLTKVAKQNCSPNYLTPYDVGPSIWRCAFMKDVMTKFKNETYRSIEHGGIQTYMERFNVWALTTNTTYTSVYQIGRPYSTLFTFLHILVRGKWMSPVYYMDLQPVFEHIIELYKVDLTIRGFNPYSDHVYSERVV